MVKAIFLKCSMYLYFFFHSIKKVEHKLGSILSTKKFPKVFDFKTNFDHKKLPTKCQKTPIPNNIKIIFQTQPIL